MPTLSFSSLLRSVHIPRGRSAGQRPRLSSGENDKKAFTEPESIKVDALYNQHQIKRRTSFLVEADCILQEGDLIGRVAANDPSAKVGCILKPTKDLREAMRVSSNVQTWHRRVSLGSTTPTSTSSGRRNSFASTQRRSSASSSAVASSSGVRTYFVLDEVLEVLEEIHEEMKDLKQIITDAEKFDHSRDLQRAIAQMALKKQAALRERLGAIEFEGEGQRIFSKLRSKLAHSLERFTVDWTLGGLEMSSAPSLQCAVASPKSRGRSHSREPLASRKSEPRSPAGILAGSSRRSKSAAASSRASKCRSQVKVSSGARARDAKEAVETVVFFRAEEAEVLGEALFVQSRNDSEGRPDLAGGAGGSLSGGAAAAPPRDEGYSALLKELQALRGKHEELVQSHLAVTQRNAELEATRGPSASPPSQAHAAHTTPPPPATSPASPASDTALAPERPPPLKSRSPAPPPAASQPPGRPQAAFPAPAPFRADTCAAPAPVAATPPNPSPAHPQVQEALPGPAVEGLQASPIPLPSSPLVTGTAAAAGPGFKFTSQADHDGAPESAIGAAAAQPAATPPSTAAPAPPAASVDGSAIFTGSAAESESWATQLELQVEDLGSGPEPSGSAGLPSCSALSPRQAQDGGPSQGGGAPRAAARAPEVQVEGQLVAASAHARPDIETAPAAAQAPAARLHPVRHEVNPYAAMPNPYANAAHLRTLVPLSGLRVPPQAPRATDVVKIDLASAKVSSPPVRSAQPAAQPPPESAAAASAEKGGGRRGFSSRVFIGTIDLGIGRVLKRNAQPVVRAVDPDFASDSSVSGDGARASG